LSIWLENAYLRRKILDLGIRSINGQQYQRDTQKALPSVGNTLYDVMRIIKIDKTVAETVLSLGKISKFGWYTKSLRNLIQVRMHFPPHLKNVTAQPYDEM